MPAGSPRRGIERRIVWSILWVGVVPLLIAMGVGFYVAHEGQAKAVMQRLSVAAEKTSGGLRIAANAHLNSLERLASDSRIVGALAQDAWGRPTEMESKQALTDVTAHLERQSQGEFHEGGPSMFILYSADGRVVTSTQKDLDPKYETLPLGWFRTVTSPRFVDLEYVDGKNLYLAQTIAPVYSYGERNRIGFISEIFDIHTLIKFGLGFDPLREQALPGSDIYSLAYLTTEANMMALGLDDTGDPEAPTLVRQPLDPELSRILLDSRNGARGTARVSRLTTVEPPSDWFVAYDRLFDAYPLFVLVRQSAWSVYAPIYTWAAIATGGIIVLITFLFLNAYRNVHNKIVRNVLLLNEGAQIIGQGDLELKLKIATGDEIEELANSFNKMALALKRNINQLEESEEKYRGLVTSMRDGVFQADRDGIIGFLNPAGADILGFESMDDAIGKDIRERFHEPGDWAAFHEELDGKGYVERSRIWMKRCDGRAICVELAGNLMHDDDGVPAGVEGIFRDVTKSIRLEHDARDRAERLSAINQIANVINSSLEAGRLYESLVVEVKKLVDFDYAELALLNEKSDAFDARQLWPEHGSAPKQYRADDERNGSAWVAQKRQCLIVNNLAAPDCPFSGQFPAAVRSILCVPLYATGRIIGTLNLGAHRVDAFSEHDIDVLEQMAPHVAVAIRNAQLLENLQMSLEEVTRAREKLHEANEELKTLDEMKTNLLSNVSHELRTPLVAVMGYTDMIINGKAGPVNEVQREYLSISLRNIEKLVTLIENLLDFSRLHRGAETLVFDTFDLLDCARASLQIVQPVADSRNIALEMLAPSEPVLVEGDKGKLGQVFNNLLSNAVKFNHSGGKVTVSLTVRESTVEVAVEDTGIGIPPEALDKVFTRFYQYDSSSTRKYGGTGIGLSIAQDIARLHGTRIMVSSEVGKGSTFRFILPLAGSRRAAEAATPEDMSPAGTRLLIELVTQDRALSTQIRTWLMSEGMDVIHAFGAEHATQLAQRHSPDCLLVDVETDDRSNGNKLIDTLLSDRTAGSLPIILLTNNDDLYTKYRALIAARVKRSFRKSSLLSGIQYALSQGLAIGEPLGHKILCVDDDPEILTFISRCLEGEGYECVTCTSGEQAVKLASTREFGLILMDIAMPGIDGWETCKRLKKDPSLAGIKVYMVTAKPIDNTSTRYRDVGADGYLLKPFRAEDLLELVQGLSIAKAEG